MQVIRRKLTAISYGAKGQDPGRLFKAYDRDGSGKLDLLELLFRRPTLAPRATGSIPRRTGSTRDACKVQENTDA